MARDYNRTTAWPYVELDTICMRKRSDLEDMRDIQKIIRSNNELADVERELENLALLDLGDELVKDVEWRALHNQVKLDYWELVGSDFQPELSPVSPLHGHTLDTKLASLEASLDGGKQAISNHFLYRNIQLVRRPVRFFHRQDGFLLTMFSERGHDFSDADLEKNINLSRETLMDMEDCSILALMFKLFADSGTSTWYYENVDWFMIYMLTEFASAPNNVRQGCNAVSLPKAYQIVVQDLKRRRYGKFERKSSILLVREFLACIDELSTINAILSNILPKLEALKQPVGEMESAQKPENSGGESAMSRILWAESRVKEDLTIVRELLADLHQSLTALFQLRSIEQNELAVAADSQSKAVFVFTGVTTVFLPLSFFTSYFGMNLKGLVQTEKTESYFWALCGTCAVLITFMASVFAYRHKVRQNIRNYLYGRVSSTKSSSALPV